MSCINEDGSNDDDDIFRIRLSSGGTRTLYIQLPSPPRTPSLTFCRGNLLNATYDVSLIHRGPPMRLAAVIRYYGRPIAIVYGGHPAPGRKHAPRQGKRRGKMLLQPDSRWAPGALARAGHYTGGLSGGAKVRVGCGQVGHDRHCDSRIHPPEVQVTFKCPGGEKQVGAVQI